MSSARLCLAGLLVAGGLILGAFTLHGYFDPQWAQKQAQAASLREPSVSMAKAVNAFRQQRRNRFVAAQGGEPKSVIKRRAPASAAPAPVKAAIKTGDAREAAKKRPAHRAAEKPKPQPEPQQAAFKWPLFDLFKN
jgi:hypothetical protein